MAKKILILECGIPVIPFEETLLLRKDNEVLRASSGNEALNLLENNKIDLLIMDDKMPDFSVEEFVSEIRKNHKNKDISILLLSSVFKEAPKGVNSVQQKPIISEKFNEACKKLLQIESRKDMRLLVYVQVQGFVHSNFFLCNSRNLSASGILILTTKNLKVGDSVQLQITLPREKEKVKAFGKVVREAKEVSTQLNAYGLHFVEISEKDRERIRKFIQEERR
ncbi:MAG: response regulator [Acidobacteria bacterium]|nr:response regulator [Acidobacteriota bacterium]